VLIAAFQTVTSSLEQLVAEAQRSLQSGLGEGSTLEQAVYRLQLPDQA